MVVLFLRHQMTQAYGLICGTLYETVIERTVMLKASGFFYQMMMIWREQLVILQTLEL
jgi:hypothetical protein